MGNSVYLLVAGLPSALDNLSVFQDYPWVSSIEEWVVGSFAVQCSVFILFLTVIRIFNDFIQQVDFALEFKKQNFSASIANLSPYNTVYFFKRVCIGILDLDLALVEKER